MWPIIFLIAIISLGWHFLAGPPRSAVWGGATWGLLIGLVWGLVTGDGISLILRGVALGACVGVVSELLFLLSLLITGQPGGRGQE